MSIANKIFRLSNLTVQESAKFLFELRDKEGEECNPLLVDTAKKKFSNLNHDLQVLTFLKEENVEIEDSKIRLRILDELKLVNWLDYNPCDVIIIAEKICLEKQDYLYFALLLITQMNIPCSYLRVACFYCSTDRKYITYIIDGINRIIFSDASLAEKYLALKLLKLITENEVLSITINDNFYSSSNFLWDTYQEDGFSYEVNHLENTYDLNDKGKNINIIPRTISFEEIESRKKRKKKDSVFNTGWLMGIHNGLKYKIHMIENQNSERKFVFTDLEYSIMIAVLSSDFNLLDDIFTYSINKSLFISISLFLLNKKNPAINQVFFSFISDSSEDINLKLKIMKMLIDTEYFEQVSSILKNHRCLMTEEQKTIFEELT